MKRMPFSCGGEDSSGDLGESRWVVEVVEDSDFGARRRRMLLVVPGMVR